MPSRGYSLRVEVIKKLSGKLKYFYLSYAVNFYI